MQGQISKLKLMKVNFRNRKVLVNFPKDQNHKVFEQKETIPQNRINLSEKKEKLTSLGQSPSTIKSTTPAYDRLDIATSKSSYIDSLADTIHLIGQEYIAYLNEGKQERFRAAIMSTLTNLQARDRRIIIEYDFFRNSQGRIEFDFDKEQEKFKQWLGEVHFRIVSTSFDFMINKLLTFTELKVYCSQNLLLNIILFIEKVENDIRGISLTDFMVFIDKTLNENLEYLMVKYPQAKEMKPNKRLREQVEPINNIQNDIHDILQHSNVQLTFNQTENYNSEIMRFINYIIEIMTEEVQIDKGSKYSFAQGFSEIMENMFLSTYLPESYYHQLKNKNLQLQSYKKQMGKLFEQNKQVKEYREKVSRYSSYILGTKLNPNTELFTQSQIKAGFFQVKSTSILRILTKWIQQLQNKIFKAKQYIQKRSFRFKNTKKSFSKLNASQKNDLYLQATKQVQKLKQCIKEIRTNAFSIQGQLAMTMKRNKQKINIPKHQYVVGEFSTKLEDAASSSLLSYLNQIIHILLLIPKNIRQKYSHDQQLQKELQIDLITFKISDLLRCKYSSHENQILRAYRELKRLSDEKDYFKIVRIKDRLELGTRDILINVNYMGRMLCEIQLAVTDEIDTKQQAYDAFNHYLYELKRSNLGAIMQSACIWAHFDQRSRIYKRIKQKQIQQYYMSGVSKKVKHQCIQPVLVDNDLPFVCTVCSKFYYSQQGIIRHKKCKVCMKFYHCALCLQNRMTQKQLKTFLGLDKLLDVFSDYFSQWYDDDYPRHGLIIPKRNKTVEIFFFTTVLWKQDAYIVRTVETKSRNQQIIDVIMIVKNNELKEWKKLKENYILYEWKQTRNVNRTIKPTSILNARREQEEKREKQEKIKKQKKQKQIQQIKEKWKRKAKLGKGKGDGDEDGGSNRSKSRPGSSQSGVSHQSGRSKTLLINNQGIPAQPMMPSIEQQKILYNESIAKVSTITQFRVAQKTITTQDQYKVINYLVLGPYYKQREIRAQLKKINNFKVIRELLQRKMQVLFLQDMLIQSEIELQQKQSEKFSNSLTKISELYLDSNLISDISFLQLMPKLAVVHLNYNTIYTMQNFTKLTELTELMLEYNKITKIEGLTQKRKLVEINLNHNQIQCIEQLEEVPKLEILALADNDIIKIENLSNLVNLKKLDLSYNQISKIQALDTLVNLQELDLSDNKIEKIQNIAQFKKLKKLNLYRNKITKIQALEQLKELKYLDLHRNHITKIQNLHNLKKLTFLNLASNKIRTIEGLKQNEAIIELNLSQNQILSLRPLIESNLNVLKILDLSYNGIKQIIGELITFLPKLQKLFINSNPIKMTKNQKQIPKKLSDEFLKRSGFIFYIIHDGNETNDTDSDYETKQQEKYKKINKKESIKETNEKVDTK